MSILRKCWILDTSAKPHSYLFSTCPWKAGQDPVPSLAGVAFCWLSPLPWPPVLLGLTPRLRPVFWGRSLWQACPCRPGFRQRLWRAPRPGNCAQAPVYQFGAGMMPKLSPDLVCHMGLSQWPGLFFVDSVSPQGWWEHKGKPCLSQHAKTNTPNKQPNALWTDHQDVMTIGLLVLVSQERVEKKQSCEGDK